MSTEVLLAELVGNELHARKAAGTYKGAYAPITHFFGYQVRLGDPCVSFHTRTCSLKGVRSRYCW